MGRDPGAKPPDRPHVFKPLIHMDCGGVLVREGWPRVLYTCDRCAETVEIGVSDDLTGVHRPGARWTPSHPGAE